MFAVRWKAADLRYFLRYGRVCVRVCARRGVPKWPDTPKTPGNNLSIATDADIVPPKGAVVVK